VLVLKGSTTLLYSKEGVTQGDLLSMFMYAVGTLPLIRSLHNPTHWTQLWYADDASAGGSLSDLHEWLSLLCSRGPTCGYFPEPTKSFVVVSERFKGEAEAVFGGLGVHVVTGHKFLGGFIGSLSARDDYVLSKVHRWAVHINVLADVALIQPQLAYAALVHSLRHEWTFLLHVFPHCGPLFGELESLLTSHFLLTLFDVEVSVAEHDLLALPLRLGGLGVSNPVSSASYFYDSSIRSTVVLVKSWVSAMLIELDAHLETVSLAKADHRKSMDSVFNERFDRLLPSFDSNQRHAIL